MFLKIIDFPLLIDRESKEYLYLDPLARSKYFSIFDKDVFISLHRDPRGAFLLTYDNKFKKVEINLSKGGTISSWKPNDQEVFVKDKDYAFVDVAQPELLKRVKGNFPIFPVFNTLLSKFDPNYLMGDIPNHGVARLSAWDAYFDFKNDVLMLELKSNLQTKKLYPYTFYILRAISLGDNTLTENFYIRSEGPFSYGYYPYFLASKDLEIVGFKPQDKYFYLPNSLTQDKKNKIVGSRFFNKRYFQGFDYQNRELNDHFLNVNRPITILDRDMKRAIQIESSPNLGFRTVYMPQDQNEICIETISALSGHFTPGQKKDPKWFNGYMMTGSVTYSVFGLRD